MGPDLLPSTPFQRTKKKPRGFIYQVYLAMRPYLGGYRGPITYRRVEGIIIRSAYKSKRVDDLLRHRRRVDIVRQCIKFMEEGIFKNEEVAFTRYPRLNPENDNYEEPDEECSDEEYVLPPTKFEPGRKPHDLHLVIGSVRPPSGSNFDQNVKALSTVHAIARANENQPPGAEDEVAFGQPNISATTVVLPEITQEILFRRLEWIMQMTCYEFLNTHDPELLYDERIHYADRTTLRYYAILICHSDALLTNSMLGEILNNSNPRPTLERVLLPLLQLHVEKKATDPIRLETFKHYLNGCHNIAVSLRSERTQKIKQLSEVIHLLFEGFAREHEKHRNTANYINQQTYGPARGEARKERDKRKRLSQILAIEESEAMAIDIAARQAQAVYTFDKYIKILKFLDKEDEISSISGSTVAVSTRNPVRNIEQSIKNMNISDEDYIDSAASSD
ncbi:hypothetical protein TWF281_006523 [Arthrobotrys megalospora]